MVSGFRPPSLKGDEFMADKPGKVEHYDKQFGIIAIEKGYISAENLIDGLRTQVEEDIQNNTHRLIGEILIDKGHMTLPQVNDIIAEMFSD